MNAPSTTTQPLPIPLCIHCCQADARITHICPPLGRSTTLQVTQVSIVVREGES